MPLWSIKEILYATTKHRFLTGIRNSHKNLTITVDAKLKLGYFGFFFCFVLFLTRSPFLTHRCPTTDQKKKNGVKWPYSVLYSRPP